VPPRGDIAARKYKFPVIKALIFDLDSCLCAANEVGDQLFEPAFDAIRRANYGDVTDSALKQAFSDCWRFPFSDVADKYGFTDEMTKAGFAAFAQVEVTEPMRGYGDLHVLRELSQKLFLVTSGFRRLQGSKINALGIRPLFTEIRIDAIDEPEPKGKLRIFGEILQKHSLKPEQVTVIGDNPDSEIAAGNRLGMKTIQVLRPGVPFGDKASYYTNSLYTLKPILSSLGRRRNQSSNSDTEKSVDHRNHFLLIFLRQPN
jgi:putative hydrolase of the HAD superfamily